MALKKEIAFTAVSCSVGRSAVGPARRRQEAAFAQVSSSRGSFAFHPVGKKTFLPESRRFEDDAAMMKHAGEALSDYLAAHPGAVPRDVLWDGGSQGGK